MIEIDFPLGKVTFGFSAEPKAQSQGLVHQVHGTDVVECQDNRKKEELVRSPPDADGVWTQKRGVMLWVFCADCLPVLLFSELEGGPIAAIHSGWRGTMKGIVSGAIAGLKTAPEQLHAVLGPSIRECCFEVREDFIQEFSSQRADITNFLTSRPAPGEQRVSHYFDLSRFVVEKELSSLPAKNIHLHNPCTFCSTPHWPSYRRNGSTDPRVRAWITRNVS